MANPARSNDYVPSEHRGPGPILDPLEAKTVRQQASQHETQAKKRKIAVDAGADGGRAMQLTLAPFGMPLSLAIYCGSRHKYGKKGKEIPESNHSLLAGMYGDNWATTHEGPLRTMVPKYDPTLPNSTVGTNLSPGLPPGTALQMGIKHHLRDELTPNRGMLISMAAVNLRQEAIIHLTASRAAGDNAPPTDDEIMAAMLLAVANSKFNLETANPAVNRIPVNKGQID